MLANSATLSIALGHPDEAAELYSRGLEIDPLNTTMLFNKSIALYADNRLEEAEATIRRGLSLTPEYSLARYRLGEVLLAQGRAAEALEAFEKEAIEWKVVQGRALALHALGNGEASDAALEALSEGLGDDAAWELAQVHAFRGETDLAFASLDEAYALHDTGLRDVKVDPLLRALHDDPSWPRFLERMGLDG